MKIFVLSNNWGGLHSFRKEVFQAFRDNGQEVYIFSSLDESVKENAASFENIGCHIIDIQFNRKGTNPLADLRLRNEHETSYENNNSEI